MKYADRLANEVDRYRQVGNVHDLPAIHKYWSNGHVRPLLRSLGFSSSDQFLLAPLIERCRSKRPVTIISLGSGNGNLELSLARSLRKAGFEEFTFRRIELNDDMRARASSAAADAGLAHHFVEEAADLNIWQPAEAYDVAIAHHSLHHVCELEHLFEHVREGLSPDGVFVVNDMIGRNGHMRWPEALDIVQRIWALMPDRYRYNHQLQRHETAYENWDCSKEGFEGVRSQDILPILNAYFQPETFIAFANIIDLFVDRGFGHNFDPDRPDDRAFIDSVARLDEAALALGLVKPTHLLAHYRIREVECRFVQPLSPQFSVRPVDTSWQPSAAIRVEGDRSVGASPAFFGRSSISEPTVESHPAHPARSIAYRIVKSMAEHVPPIRRLRVERDALAVEVESLRASATSASRARRDTDVAGNAV